jgi:soluble lytic murein transglycosylase-like protein
LNSLFAIIQLYSSIYGIDPRLVQSIVQYESKYNPNAIGAQGEIGLMQIMPSTAKVKRKDLFDPNTNILEGVKYLSQMKEQCKHKEDNTFLVCYNLGVSGGSKIKHPKKFKYYKEVMKIYRSMN